ncbi:MAG: hypothetical protein V4445_00980 [Pseudomonadota bacterium]
MQFIQNILKKFSSPKSVDTLAWANELKGMDDISAITFCAEQLHADVQKDLFTDDKYLTALLRIDEKMHIIVEKVTTQYVNIDHINTDIEERIENTVFLYHRQIFLIYFGLIETLAPINHPSLPVILIRAMNSAIQMIKWRYYSYQSSPANIWLQLSQLYKIAEQQSLLNSNIQSYTDQESIKISTVYIEACMLGSLESLSLKCQQIDLISKMLAAWTDKITIDSIYSEESHLFYIDTSSNTPAKRIRNFKPADTYRYWRFDHFNTNIELCLSLIEFNISPKQHTIKDFIKNPDALATLEILRAEWSLLDYKRQRRSEERIKTVKPATTAYGFEDTCYQLKQYESPQSEAKSALNDSTNSGKSVSQLAYAEPNVIYMDFGAGYSNIVDESGKGVGLHISKRANEVSLGMIVCVTVKEQKTVTKIGAIRSIRPIAGGELHVGVEVFSRSALRLEGKTIALSPIQSNLHASGESQCIADSALGFICLYLPKENGVSIQETLIFPRHLFNKNQLYKINTLGVERIIKPLEILEQREDWVRVTYTHDLSK